jgi:hypothetical protein
LNQTEQHIFDHYHVTLYQLDEQSQFLDSITASLNHQQHIDIDMQWYSLQHNADQIDMEIPRGFPNVRAYLTSINIRPGHHLRQSTKHHNYLYHNAYLNINSMHSPMKGTVVFSNMGHILVALPALDHSSVSMIPRYDVLTIAKPLPVLGILVKAFYI